MRGGKHLLDSLGVRAVEPRIPPALPLRALRRKVEQLHADAGKVITELRLELRIGARS